MTEQEWLSGRKAAVMIAYLQGKGSDRKLRLLGCAYAQQARKYMNDERSLKAVDAAEAFADGAADLEVLESANRAAQGVFDEWTQAFRTGLLATLPFDSVVDNQALAIGRAAVCATFVSTTEHFLKHATPAWFAAQDTREALAGLYFDLANSSQREDPHHCAQELAKRDEHLRNIVLEVFGNPFRSLPIHPSWRTLPVKSLAEVIYHQRTFHFLPILADALEDVGCNNADILDHLRQPGDHVPGCWALDLVLDKG